MLVSLVWCSRIRQRKWAVLGSMVVGRTKVRSFCHYQQDNLAFLMVAIQQTSTACRLASTINIQFYNQYLPVRLVGQGGNFFFGAGTFCFQWENDPILNIMAENDLHMIDLVKAHLTHPWWFDALQYLTHFQWSYLVISDMPENGHFYHFHFHWKWVQCIKPPSFQGFQVWVNCPKFSCFSDGFPFCLNVNGTIN